MESWKKEESVVKINDCSYETYRGVSNRPKYILGNTFTLNFEGSDLQIGVFIDIEPNFKGYKSKVELYPCIEDTIHKETIERDTLEKAKEDSLKIVFDKVYNFLSEIGEYLNLKVSYTSNE